MATYHISSSIHSDITVSLFTIWLMDLLDSPFPPLVSSLLIIFTDHWYQPRGAYLNRVENVNYSATNVNNNRALDEHCQCVPFSPFNLVFVSGASACEAFWWSFRVSALHPNHKSEMRWAALSDCLFMSSSNWRFDCRHELSAVGVHSGWMWEKTNSRKRKITLLDLDRIWTFLNFCAQSGILSEGKGTITRRRRSFSNSCFRQTFMLIFDLWPEIWIFFDKFEIWLWIGLSIKNLSHSLTILCRWVVSCSGWNAKINDR